MESGTKVEGGGTLGQNNFLTGLYLIWCNPCIHSLTAERKLLTPPNGIDKKLETLKRPSMKKTLPFFLAAVIAGCGTERAIQVNIEEAQLVKIDTIQRYNASEKLLTWRTSDQVDYVTYVPLLSHYTIGSKMKVMIKR